MNVVFDVIIAFFASVGFLYIVWHILMSISKGRGALYGKLIYIPDTKDDEVKAAQLFSGDEGKYFHGELIMLCGKELNLPQDIGDKENYAVEELCNRFEKVYKYRAETIWIGQRSEGSFNIRRND